MVHRPKENLSSRVGVTGMGCPSASRVICCESELIRRGPSGASGRADLTFSVQVTSHLLRGSRDRIVACQYMPDTFMLLLSTNGPEWPRIGPVSAPLHGGTRCIGSISPWGAWRSEEHTSELQSRQYLVCRLLL